MAGMPPKRQDSPNPLLPIWPSVIIYGNCISSRQELASELHEKARRLLPSNTPSRPHSDRYYRPVYIDSYRPYEADNEYKSSAPAGKVFYPDNYRGIGPVNELTEAFKSQCTVMDGPLQTNGGAQHRQGYHGGGRDNRKRRYRGKFFL
jgi:hypothetical protein